MRSYAAAALAAVPLALGMPTTSQVNTESAIAPGYIVVLKPTTTESVLQVFDNLASTFSTQASGPIARTHTFDSGFFKGFAATLNAVQIAAIQADPRVAYVEKNGVMHTLGDFSKTKRDTVTQTGATWGLGRISHRAKGSTDYLYDSSAGAGTCSYVIDTGVYAEHPEFEGRATFVKNLSTGSNATTDDNGHGTHVSGTIASKDYGVAKKTLLYGIKVLDAQGSGSYADVISGINYAVTDSKTRTCPNGIVVNMSLGGGKSQSVNDAVAAAVDAGLFFAVAAGNEGQDYHNTSPASEPKAFAVGASDKNDAIASFSNFGAGLGVIAPGVNILSTWIGGPDKTNTISGTSMATPHVVGLAAYLLGLTPGMTPAAIKAKIQSLATNSIITGLNADTPNQLAYNGISGDASPPPSKPTPTPTPAPAPAPSCPWYYWPFCGYGKSVPAPAKPSTPYNPWNPFGWATDADDYENYEDDE